MKFSPLLILALAAATLPAGAAPPVQPALDRAALTIQEPTRAVLLAAAAAGERLVAVGERGLVLRSEDRGATWVQVAAPVSVTLTAVRFADARTGWATGHGGTVLATSDGGGSWTRVLDGKRIAQIELDAAQAAGDAAWQKAAARLQADGPDKPLLDLLVFDAHRVLAVGAYGLAIYSEDGGRNWVSWRARMDNPKELHLYAVRREGEQVLIAGEQGLVMKSADGGLSFRRLTLPYAGSFFTAEATGPQSWVVAGLRGNVWRTDDGGTTWQVLASPMPVNVTASALVQGGRLLLANQAGLLLADAGGMLAPRPGSPLPPVNALLPLADGRVLALTMQGLLLRQP
jgi:photosystem II stability/assembly factor-like uncharacterized protein